MPTALARPRLPPLAWRWLAAGALVAVGATLGLTTTTARRGAPTSPGCGVWPRDPTAITAVGRMAEHRRSLSLTLRPCRGGLARSTWTGERPIEVFTASVGPGEVRDERAALVAAAALSPIADRSADATIEVHGVRVPAGSPAGRALMTVFERLEARDIAAATAATAKGELTLALVADDVRFRLAPPLRLERLDGRRWRPIALPPRDVLPIVMMAADPIVTCGRYGKFARVTWTGHARGRPFAGDGRRTVMPDEVVAALRAPYVD